MILDARGARASKRPGAIAGIAAFRCACAAVVALPIAFELGRPTSAFPTGDGVLFEPGAELLVEVLRVNYDGLAAAVTPTLALVLAVAWMDLAATAALLVALASKERLRFGPWLGRSMALWPALVGAWGVTLLAVGVVALLFVLLGGLVAVPVAGRMSERSGDLLLAGVFVVGLSTLLGIGAVADLTRAALVDGERTLRQALGAALRTARSRTASMLLGWSAPALGTLAAVLAGAWLVGHARLERGHVADLTAVVMVHGLVVLGLTALRAVWLSHALRLVASSGLSSAPPALADTPGDSAAPADPS